VIVFGGFFLGGGVWVWGGSGGEGRGFCLCLSGVFGGWWGAGEYRGGGGFLGGFFGVV